MISLPEREQKGLMPSWQNGRLIEGVFGYVACLAILGGVGSFLLGWVWPVLGEKSVSELMISLGIGLLPGTIWLFLRLEKLKPARIALLSNGVFFTGTLIWWLRDYSISNPFGFSEGVASLICVFILGWIFWRSQREVAMEIRHRSEDPHDLHDTSGI